MMRKYALWPLFLISFSLFTGWIMISEIAGPARVIAVFLFASLCPGLALMRLFFRVEGIAMLVLSAACSLVISAGVAVISLYGRMWNPEISFLFLIAFTLALSILDLIRREPLSIRTVSQPILSQKPVLDGRKETESQTGRVS